MIKGIVLAGGLGSRLYPSTKVISKQLLPLYDKPMIYYPISVLMLANIRDICIISDANNINSYKALLGDGSDFGVAFNYQVQDEPNGIASAFILAEDFIGSSNVFLILGDNLFFGAGFSLMLQEASKNLNGAHVFAYEVNDPERFGVLYIDKKNKIEDIIEKPKSSKSNLAVTGMYLYDNSVVGISKDISFSKRGEREITDVNKAYLKKNKLQFTVLGRGFTWLDAGTPDSFLSASFFVQTLIKKQGLQIACLEEIALRQGWLDINKIKKSKVLDLDNDYSRYIKKIILSKKYY